MLMWLLLLSASLFAAAVAIYFWRTSRGRARTGGAAAEHHGDTEWSPAEGEATIPFQTEATAQLAEKLYCLAFGVMRSDYRIMGQHSVVLAASKAAVGTVMEKKDYFPRRPAMLPKLLRAINAGDSSRLEIVRLILQDPVLAGNVLKRANSAYYRPDVDAVESVDRAVVILGFEGLRAPAAAAVMQPVFKLPRGFFDRFAPIVWEQAQRTAAAAEAYARANRSGDSFVANLLGLLGGLGRMVIFRLTLDKYRTQPNIMPRAEVFIRVMLDHGFEVTRIVAAAWEMSPPFLAAIDAQIAQTPPQRMAPLARTLYYGNLCGALALLHRLDQCTLEEARVLLTDQGLSEEAFATMWPAACAAELSAPQA